jgi:uncharacterized protein
MSAALELHLLPGRMAVCQLPPDAEPPLWCLRAPGFCSLTRTADEWSAVCAEETVPDTVRSEKGWRLFRVAGTLDFSLTGVMASIAGPLAGAEVSLFAIATYDTDYVMVKADRLDQATAALRAAGHVVRL